MIMKNDKIKDEEEMTSFPNNEILENENIKNGKIFPYIILRGQGHDPSP